jgi:prephenate dehydrogenase
VYVSVIIERLAVIGVGLIGGSFALALKRAGAVSVVTGCGRSKDNLKEALEMGAIDDATTDPEQAVSGAEVVMLSVPLRSMAPLAKTMGHALKPGAIVTDAGSAKEIVLGELFAHLPPSARVVAGHPIAGSEKTGAGAASPDLFVGRRVILIQDPRTDDDALALVRSLWEACGARVELMGAHEHDLVLGAVSHLPHMAAYALTDALLAWDDELPMLRFSAGGLRDFTRIAASSPEMWRDICLDNAAVIVEAIDRYVQALLELRAEVAGQKGAALLSRFERCREVRKRMAREERG